MQAHFDSSVLQEFSEKLMTTVHSDCASCNMVDGVAIVRWLALF